MGKNFRETLNEQLKDPRFKAEWDTLAPERQSNCARDMQYYRLELDDYSAVSFCNFGKYYFGTLEEIGAFINMLDKEYEDTHRELVSAFRAYEGGQTDVAHHVAFQKVPLLTPARLVHTEKVVLKNHAWDHTNTWQRVYKMRCTKVETEHLWLECEGRYFRVMKATFTKLRYESILGGWRQLSNNMLWGFPCILREDTGHFWNTLAEPEKGFQTMEELDQDWEEFKKNPDPQFTEFCNDIFGDG